MTIELVLGLAVLFLVIILAILAGIPGDAPYRLLITPALGEVFL